MIKNVIRQLNTKIEQKQLAVAAAAQTDATHLARIKDVSYFPRTTKPPNPPITPLPMHLIIRLQSDSSFQNSSQKQVGRAVG